MSRLNLKGSVTYSIEPQEYHIEGVVYTRGKEYQKVKNENLKLFESINKIVFELPGASFIPSNTYAITSDDLAFSEIKELEYRDGFRVKAVNINDVDTIVHRLSTVKGVIVNEVFTITRDSPDAFWANIEKAKENLNDKVRFYEESFGVKLKLIAFKPYKKRETRRKSKEEELEELEEFVISTRRKRPERVDKAQVEKGFYEKIVTIELSADYEVHFNDPAAQNRQ